jgi:DNA modification methylase
MSVEAFLNGRVTLYGGDSLDILRTLPDASIDSCVCDPPYALVSIGKRFGKPGSAPAKGDVYGRATAGFMGKSWDTGERAFAVEFWAEVYRVLKPGGHVLAFGGTRTVHRLTCAIEDVGFEIRDMIAWLYGSGFPKSHDVSKGIDKRRDWTALPRLQGAVRTARLALGISQSEAARRAGVIGEGESLGGGGFMWFETGMRAPTREQWPRLKAALLIGDEFDECFAEAEREITGTVDEWADRSNYALTSKDGFRRDKPASDAAREWQGWGTALKPALEPITFARKPLVGTVAENVLTYGTGALNINGCRVEGSDAQAGRTRHGGGVAGNGSSYELPDSRGEMPAGRWPANVLLDGSDDVVGAFPDAPGQQRSVGPEHGAKSSVNVFGDYGARDHFAARGDSGSAARFFYNAKADSDDRIGSKHPTVKPVDLMRWCCRLVTPPGGVVLDPFAGTGTTGEAAFYEGFSAVLIEREAEYRADIARRMKLVMSGPDERRRAIVKAKAKPDDLTGTLFAPAAPMAAE